MAIFAAVNFVFIPPVPQVVCWLANSNLFNSVELVIFLMGFALLFLPFGLDLLPSGFLITMVPSILVLLAAKPHIHNGNDYTAQRMLRVAMLLGLLGFCAASILNDYFIQ